MRFINRFHRFALPTAIFLVAAALIVPVFWPNDSGIENSRWISESFERLEHGMTIDEVAQVLGPPGDHRIDPQKGSMATQPLVPFVKPDSSYLKSDMNLGFDGAIYRILKWKWDNGAIEVYFSFGQPHELRHKKLVLSDGPRSKLSRAADPLRLYVYKHVDNRQYNQIWWTAIGIAVTSAVALIIYVRVREKRGR